MRYCFLCLCVFFPFILNALTMNGELTKNIQVIPGESYDVKLTLRNSKDYPEEIALKQVDYRYTSKGENFFEEPGTFPRSNASWIHLDTKLINLKPGEVRDVYYSVQVPKDENLIGSYSSAILIEPMTPAAELLQNKGQFTLQVKIRYAHQLITTVGKPHYALKLLDHSVGTYENQPAIFVDVKNTGNGHLYPKLTLKLFDTEGKNITELSAQAQNILPDSSVRYMLPLQDSLKGNYLGLLLFDAGNAKIFGEKIHLHLP